MFQQEKRFHCKIGFLRRRERDDDAEKEENHITPKEILMEMLY